LDCKLSSDEAVKRVLAGEKGDLKGRTSLTSKAQELDNKNAREEEPRVHKDKEDKRNSEINERSTSRDRKQKEEVKEESKAREKDKEKEKTKETDRDRHKDPERDKHREGERERVRNRAKQDRDRGNRDRDKDLDRAREKRNEGGKEKERWKDREREREQDKARDRDRRRVKDGEHSRDPDREKTREHDKPDKKSSSSGEVSKKLPDGSLKDSKAETETEISTRASRSVTTKASKRRSENSVEGTANLSHKELKIWILITVSGRKNSLWLEGRSAVGGDKQRLCEKDEDMSLSLSLSLTHTHTSARTCVSPRHQRLVVAPLCWRSVAV